MQPTTVTVEVIGQSEGMKFGENQEFAPIIS